MKIIYPEKQTVTGSSATNADGSFPIANLFDNKPGKLYKVRKACFFFSCGYHVPMIPGEIIFCANPLPTFLIKDSRLALISIDAYNMRRLYFQEL